MSVAFCVMDGAVLFLIAHLCVENPVVLQYFLHSRSFRRIDLEHTSNDVPALARKDPEEPPWSFDYFLLVATRGGRPSFVNTLGLVMAVV
jgi:hypothetical protein